MHVNVTSFKELNRTGIVGDLPFTIGRNPVHVLPAQVRQPPRTRRRSSGETLWAFEVIPQTNLLRSVRRFARRTPG